MEALIIRLEDYVKCVAKCRALGSKKKQGKCRHSLSFITSKFKVERYRLASADANQYGFVLTLSSAVYRFTVL